MQELAGRAGAWEKPTGKVWKGQLGSPAGPGQGRCRARWRWIKVHMWVVCSGTKLRFINRKGNCSTLPGLMAFSK